MVRFMVPLFLLAYTSTAFSAIFQLPSSNAIVSRSAQSNAIARPLTGPLIPPISNLTADPIHITCDPARYGQNLKVPSCKKAFKLIVRNDTEVILADRASLVKHNIPLPYRLQSSDGLCYLQVILAENAVSGRASSTEFGRAAYNMIEQCVVKYGYGGIASQIGGDNELSVIVTSYKPNVKCTKAVAPPWNSTVTIFANMLATKGSERFGRAGTPNVEFYLPFFLKASDGRAVFKIDSDGRTTTSSWYAIWEAVTAIAYMCSTPGARSGGKASKLGALANMNVELFDLNPRLGQSESEVRNSTWVGDLYVEGQNVPFSADMMATE